MHVVANLTELDSRVGQIRYFPAPSNLVISLFRTITKQDCTFEDISSIVEPDASLSSQLLKVANSAYYGFKGKVSTVDKAVRLIGVQEVRNLCLAICLVNQFRTDKLAKQFDIKQFWTHNLLTSFCARELGKTKAFVEPDQLYMMGLLHDIGRLAMAQVFPNEFNAIIQMARKKKVCPWQIEREFGLIHTDIGHLLARRWSLTPEISDVMQFHHEPTKSKKFSRECSLVNIAAYLAKKIENNCNFSFEPRMPDQRVLLLAGVDFENMMSFLERANKLGEEVNALLQIIVN